MEIIGKNISKHFNLFNLGNPEITRIYTEHLEVLVTNFPYFEDLPTLTSYFRTKNKKFNQKFYTLIAKFIEIIKYDESKDNKTKRRDEEEHETTTASETTSSVEKEQKENRSAVKIKINAFEQFLKETDSQPFSLGSDDDMETSSATEGKPQEKQKSALNNSSALKNGNALKNASALNNDNALNNSSALKNGNALKNNNAVNNSAARKAKKETKSVSNVLDSVEIINLKKAFSSLMASNSDPLFPNHFPAKQGFVVNKTPRVMKYYTEVLSFHVGKFVITTNFIKNVILKVNYGDIREFLYRLIKEKDTLKVLASSTVLEQLFFKNTDVLEMILEILKISGSDVPEEKHFVDEIYRHKQFLVYHLFEEGIRHGYVKPEMFYGVSSTNTSPGQCTVVSNPETLNTSSSTSSENTKSLDFHVCRNDDVETFKRVDLHNEECLPHKYEENLQHNNEENLQHNNEENLQHNNEENSQQNKNSLPELESTTNDCTLQEINKELAEIQTALSIKTPSIAAMHSFECKCDLSMLQFFRCSTCDFSGVPAAFPHTHKVLLMLCENFGDLEIPEIMFDDINRVTLYYYQLLSYNKRHSREMTCFLQSLFFEYTHCSLLLSSVTRVLTNAAVDDLVAVGFFEKLRVSILHYASAYHTNKNTDNLFSYIIKLYNSHKAFIESAEYLNSLEKAGCRVVEQIKRSWVAAHELMAYFNRLETFDYRKNSDEAFREYDGFVRYIIDCFLSEIPFPNLFIKN